MATMRVPARVGLLCILSMLSFQHPTLGNLIQRPHRGAALRMASEDRTVPASEDRTMPAEQMPANAFVELAVATSATAKFGFFGWLHKQIFGPTPISPNYKCTPGTGWNADDNGKLSSYGTCKALPAMNTEAGKTEEKKDARVHPSPVHARALANRPVQSSWTFAPSQMMGAPRPNSLRRQSSRKNALMVLQNLRTLSLGF